MTEITTMNTSLPENLDKLYRGYDETNGSIGS